MRSARYLAAMVNGKLVKGKKTDEIVFYYDKHGNLVKRVIVYPVEKGRYKPQAGEDGLTMQHAFNDSATVINQCTYDERGNLINLEHDPMIYGLSGTFKYNSKNQITETRQYNNYKGGIADGMQSYQYNNDGKLTQRLETNAKNHLLEKTTFEYDKAGCLIQVITTDSAHTVSRTKLIYDNLTGKMMHLVLIGDEGDYPIQYNYEYDNHDRKVRIFMVYNTTKRLYSSFKYDASGSGYQYTEHGNGGQTIVQTLSPGLRKRETFENEHPRDISEWHYDKHNNIIWLMNGQYLLPSQKIELAGISVVVNDIKYRGGIFSRIGLLFKHKPIPPRGGGM